MRTKHQDIEANHLAKKLGAQCDQCCLKDAGPCVFGRGGLESKIAIVGEAPGQNEIEAGMPFVGLSGEELDKLLGRLGVHRSRVFVTNALLHMPPGGDLEVFIKRKKREAKEADVPFADPVELCQPRLFKELGVRKCKRCDKWELGTGRCVCKLPDWVGQSPFEVIIPMGNAALKSLLGFEGITKYRGSIYDSGLLRKGFYR